MLNARAKDWLQMQKILLGLRTGTVLTGPWHVQIDLTNACNNDCVGCWCHSPLLGELAMDEETKKQTLPEKLVRKLIGDLARMGTREIYFTGGGDPFMHPRAVEIMEYVKQLGMRCDMSCNFTLMTEEKAERMVRAGVDNINCSLWAGSPEAYAKTHPNKNAETFKRIEEMFFVFDRLKKKYSAKTPTLRIYNVISSYNWDDFDNMLAFAHRVRADAVDFTPTDIVPGKTDCLMLDADQRRFLAKRMAGLDSALDRLSRQYGHRIGIMNREQFARRIESTQTESGVYDQSIIGTMPCYAGWTFLRILANGNVNACLKAVRIPVGNVRDKSIRSIWRGEKQHEFRRHTLKYKVDDPFFSNIGNSHQTAENGCLLCCDNLGLNLLFHGKLGSKKKKS